MRINWPNTVQFNQLNYIGQNFTEAVASVASSVATALYAVSRKNIKKNLEKKPANG